MEVYHTNYQYFHVRRCSRLGKTLFKGRIVECVLKVLQCLTSVRNVKSFEYIIMDNIQLV